jgi:hypothetical protein
MALDVGGPSLSYGGFCFLFAVFGGRIGLSDELAKHSHIIQSWCEYALGVKLESMQ